ncbi:hypothetical protein [uncultured Castellaniella sp.]|uniref:hypothetical protein n=1 Tax=uncultured Castellaniella sp. TaxID=647907 RepID=UPI00260E2E95|nr:hypothetical protein [uncultured Castellaniella sp.]
MAGSMGLDMAWAGRGAAGIPLGDAAGALQGPWVPGRSWGGRLAGRSSGRGAARRPAASAPSAMPARQAAAARRPRRALGIGWRRLAALAGDVLMVLVWAAMVPGLMWLGVAAGF